MMSLVPDSPVPSSSSSDDFAALLEEELDTNSPETSSEEETEVQNEIKEDEGNGSADSDRIKRPKLEGKYNAAESSSDRMQKTEICVHPGHFRGLCLVCAQPVDDEESGVALAYIHKDLKLRSTEIDRLRGSDLKNLLLKKKLILILDLDHTLLNSTRFLDISSDEQYLLRDADLMHADPKKTLFKLGSMHLLTKLRPFLHTFLSEASALFDMYIYTMAERSYALEIARFLDPDEIYFHSKVISQSDCTQKYVKGLDIVLGAESTVVILDDTETVWHRHKDNLIQMERYHYFSSSCRQFQIDHPSLAASRKDENESGGALSSILNVLKRVHEMFFDPAVNTELSNRDVRQILQKVRQEILKGCTIVFSRIFPTASSAEDQTIWKKCRLMGAICCTEVNSSVTHVISKDKGTEKARWAVSNEKLLVNPDWVEAAYFLWRRMPEEDFPVAKS